MAKYFISGSEKEYSLNMNKMATTNFFKQLGIMVKKMTCLFTTRERFLNDDSRPCIPTENPLKQTVDDSETAELLFFKIV